MRADGGPRAYHGQSLLECGSRRNASNRIRRFEISRRTRNRNLRGFFLVVRASPCWNLACIRPGNLEKPVGTGWDSFFLKSRSAEVK